MQAIFVPMKIGIIGTRGIPNRYGGFEQFVEFTAPALVAKGFDVTVYNSSLHPLQLNEWNGVKIITCNDPENLIGTAGQFIYDLNCIINCRRQHFDIILQLGYTSSSIWNFLLPSKSIVITNMDGLEWKRSKYSNLVKKFLKYAEKIAARKSDFLIADSKGIQQYILETYNKQSAYIAYGALPFTPHDKTILNQFGVSPYKYNLLIARMEKENNIEAILKGHLLANTSTPLLVVGNTNNGYGRMLQKKYNSSSVKFCNAIYDLNLLNHLRWYSHYYFHGHSVGGTNPSLLEAMASGALIIAHNNIFNRSVLGDDAFYFETPEDITAIINKQDSKEKYADIIQRNSTKIAADYSWQKITNQLDTLFRNAFTSKS